MARPSLDKKTLTMSEIFQIADFVPALKNNPVQQFCFHKPLTQMENEDRMNELGADLLDRTLNRTHNLYLTGDVFEMLLNTLIQYAYTSQQALDLVEDTVRMGPGASLDVQYKVQTDLRRVARFWEELIGKCRVEYPDFEQIRKSLRGDR